MAAASTTPQDLVAEGVRLYQAGDLDGAARHYEAALAQAPDAAHTLYLLAAVRRQQGRLAEAAVLLEGALASQPKVPAYHAGLGVLYRALGRADEADRAFARVMALCPDVAEAHHDWGLAIRQMGDRPAALAHLRRAVELDPGLGAARVRLVELLLESGRPDEALEHGRAAVALRPDDIAAHLGLAAAWLALGRPIEARDAYGQAVRLDRGNALAAAGMGIAASHLHLRDEAMAWLRRAVELEPNSVEFLRHLGEAASAFGLRDEVRWCCDRILAIDPDNAAAHNTLGSIAHREGRRDEARAGYLRAVRHEPRLAAAHYNLGLLHEEMGEKDEAEARFREAVRREPGHALALARLASIHRAALPDADLESIHRVLGTPGLPQAQRLKLLFSVAEVFDARGEFARAAAWLEQANALGRDLLLLRGQPYNPDQHREFIDAQIATFSPDLLDRLAGGGLGTNRPVFIVGLPRSGTTLIEQVLASHPEVLGAGEIKLVRQSLREVPEVVQHPGPPLEAVGQLRPAHVAELARRHDQRLRALDGGRAARVINKLPENTFYLGIIALMFPGAVVIHCRRDLRDVALSCWAADFAEVTWAHQYDHIASRFAESRRIMDHWRTALPGRFAVHEVAYEEAVDDLEGVARRLLAAMGLDWHPSCLEFHKTRRPVESASLYQVRRPLYRTSVGRWKHYEKELAGLFAAVMGPAH